MKKAILYIAGIFFAIGGFFVIGSFILVNILYFYEGFGLMVISLLIAKYV